MATECQDWLAFNYDGCQYTWAKMTSAVTTYLADILIASETEEEHDKYLRAMIDYFQVKGHKLSYDKAHMSQPEVIYLGTENLTRQTRNLA